MLVHHADSQFIGIVWGLNPDFLSVLLDDSFFRLIHAEQHAHQRRFSGSVFSQQGMNLSFF